MVYSEEGLTISSDILKDVKSIGDYIKLLIKMAIQPLTNYHPVVFQILALLEKSNCWFETFEHEPVRTSEEAANLRDGYTLQQGAKAILIRVKISSAEKRFAMLVVPGNTRFDSNKVTELFHAKDIRFATEAEVL